MKRASRSSRTVPAGSPKRRVPAITKVSEIEDGDVETIDSDRQ